MGTLGRRELGDPSTGLRELGLLGARDTQPQTAIDEILVPPVVDRLSADAEPFGDFSDSFARREQIEDLGS